MDRNVERIVEPDAHEAAADWLQRLEHPQLKEEDIQSWLEWFGAADTHRKAFEELQVLRRKFRELPEDLRQELKQRLSAEPTTNEGQARFAAPPSNNRRNAFPRHVWALAASVCAIALGFGAWWKIQTHTSQATYLAPVDHHRTVALDDGSSLVLGASSVVDVAYSRNLRTLNVKRGEAYFEVAEDAKRPFIVRAAGVRVTAIGTAFNVQREVDTVTVTVTEGRVAIEDGKTDTASPAYLDVGQQAVLPVVAPKPVAASKPVSKSDPVISDWEKGRADFINAPLSEVLPVINRYAPRKLVIDDPRVADLTYSGTIFRSHLDEWVASLPRVYAIRAVPLEDGTITLVSRPSEEKVAGTP